MFLMPGVQSIGRWGNVMGGQDFTNDTYVDGSHVMSACTPSPVVFTSRPL